MNFIGFPIIPPEEAEAIMKAKDSDNSKDSQYIYNPYWSSNNKLHQIQRAMAVLPKRGILKTAKGFKQNGGTKRVNDGNGNSTRRVRIMLTPEQEEKADRPFREVYGGDEKQRRLNKYNQEAGDADDDNDFSRNLSGRRLANVLVRLSSVKIIQRSPDSHPGKNGILLPSSTIGATAESARSRNTDALATDDVPSIFEEVWGRMFNLNAIKAD